MMIQSLQRQVERKDREIERKSEELEKAKIRIKLLEKEFENKENKPLKVKKKTTEKKIFPFSQEKKQSKQETLSCLSQVSISFFKEFCSSYEKMFEDFTLLVEKQKEEYSEDRSITKMSEYENEVEEQFEDIFQFQQKLKNIEFQKNEIKEIVEGY